MTHVIPLWWVGLCAKCKSLFPPGASESLDSHQPGLSWWHRRIRGAELPAEHLGNPPCFPKLHPNLCLLPDLPAGEAFLLACMEMSAPRCEPRQNRRDRLPCRSHPPCSCPPPNLSASSIALPRSALHWDPAHSFLGVMHRSRRR